MSRFSDLRIFPSAGGRSPSDLSSVLWSKGQPGDWTYIGEDLCRDADPTFQMGLIPASVRSVLLSVRDRKSISGHPRRKNVP